MKRRNNKTFGLVLCFLFFIPSLFYSQTLKDAIFSAIPESGSPSAGKDVSPIFILQGAVKLKGRPENGVALTLTKDGKAISKIITPRNGLYYFQLKRSGTDSQSEYLLIISKANVAAGTLKISTYTPKERLTGVPYIFNLDINIAPITSSGAIEKRDFGRIKWIAEKNAFNFDKDYVPVHENERIADSLKQVAVAKENAELKRQADSIAAFMAIAIEEEAIKEKAMKIKSAKEKAAKIAAEKAAVAKELAKQTNTKTATKSAKANEVIANSKTDENTSKSKIPVVMEPNQNTKSSKINNAQTANESSKTAASGGNEKNKLQQQQNTKGSVDLMKNTSYEKGGVKTKEGTSGNMADVMQNTSLNQRILILADSLAAAGASPKDLFFLTGVPMEQFKKNLSTGAMNDKNDDVYDANEVFSANNERNRLLALKQRYERKKAENFAKKQETNNTLTSLMDEVEEYDKNKKK